MSSSFDVELMIPLAKFINSGSMASKKSVFDVCF